MEKVNKFEKVAISLIEKARFVVMTTFAAMAAMTALAALICFFRDLEIINLIGVIGGGYAARIAWEVRRG